MGFLKQVTKLKAKILREGLWQKVGVDKVLQRAGTQRLQTYLDRRHAAVAEWVALRTIFDVFARDMGYKGAR